MTKILSDPLVYFLLVGPNDASEFRHRQRGELLDDQPPCGILGLGGVEISQARIRENRGEGSEWQKLLVLSDLEI
jgi:hypothetical protein